MLIDSRVIPTGIVECFKWNTQGECTFEIRATDLTGQIVFWWDLTTPLCAGFMYAATCDAAKKHGVAALNEVMLTKAEIIQTHFEGEIRRQQALWGEYQDPCESKSKSTPFLSVEIAL